MTRQGRREAGFSIIELMVVAVILGIVSALAVPGLISALRAANEAAAVHFLRDWNSAQYLYLQKNGFYASSDEALVNEGFLGKGIVNGTADDRGYTYAIDTDNNPDFWSGRADPRSELSGRFHYYNDVSGTIRFNAGGPASRSDPPIGGPRPADAGGGGGNTTQ